MLDAETERMIAEPNAGVAGLSEAVDNLCAVIAARRLENGMLRLELLAPDFVEAPWLAVGQA